MLNAEDAPIAQLDRASVYGTEGLGFESLWAHCKTPSQAAESANWLGVLFVSVDTV